MAILDRTRKILWGRSGNRCAICKQVLVADATALDRESIISEECHIVSGAKLGPRHDPEFPTDQIDECDNLILLCRSHHKMVDDQVATFTAEILRQMKINHESWVTTSLEEEKATVKPVRIRRKKENMPKHLKPILTGRELFARVQRASGYLFDHEELESEEEVDLVSDFLQNLQDWGEVGGDLESGEQVKASYCLGRELSTLAEKGFCVFGAEEIRYLEGGTALEPTPLSTAMIRVIRTDSKDIYMPTNTSVAEANSADKNVDQHEKT